jgi:hypothetical protein
MQYDFDVKIIERQGSIPKCDGWTYHHVLPWKYYYSLSSILMYYYISVLISSTKLDINARANYIETKATSGSIVPETKISVEKIFNPNISCLQPISRKFSYMQLHNFSYCLCALARTPEGFIDNVLTKDGLAAQILTNGTSPIFGGFSGMDGSQRSDDPGSSREKNKPLSGAKEWWSSLTNIGIYLEKASENKIIDAKKDDVIHFNFSDDELDFIILALIPLALKYNYTVLSFNANDWGMFFGNVNHDITLSSVTSPQIVKGNPFYVKTNTSPNANKIKVEKVGNKLHM